MKKEDVKRSMKGKMKKFIIIVCISLITILTLSACGDSGLKLESGGSIPVTDTGDEEVNGYCDEILTEIIDKDMTDVEKAYAAYEWVENNIRYSGNTTKGDFIRGAKLALSKRTGDCYAFCTSLRALLMRMGFETEEVPGYRNYHFWIQSKIDGNWYYLDATTGWGGERFMLTEKELEEYSYKNPGYTNPLTYEWNKEKCHETP